ncbi:MAG: hypothetical protein Q8S00_25605 [Deltaproteobacteria bacterium]|nr:hypothetical protein [Deltaproteobacteria bacterium]
MTRAILKQQAIDLRGLGYSYNLIRKEIGVSKSTLSDWLKDLPYRPNETVVHRIAKATKQMTMARKKDRLQSLTDAKQEAQKELPAITKRDLWMLGLALYMGEGSKTTGVVRFANSDPETIRLMMRWFREVLDLKNDNFRLRVHLYPDNDEVSAKNYWSKLAGLPNHQFGKTQFDTRKNKLQKRRNSLPYGTLHIVILARGEKRHGIFLFRKIMFWAEQVFSDMRE